MNAKTAIRVAAAAATVACFIGLSLQRERAARPQTPPSPPSETAQPPAIPPPSQGSNPARASPQPPQPPPQSRQPELFPEARALSETVHSSGDGRSLLRVAILETSLKRPRVRLEERYRVDPDTGEPILAHSVAFSAEHLILNLPEGEDPLEAAQALRANGVPARVLWANSPVLLAPVDIGLETDALQRAAAALLPALDPAYTLEPDYLQFASAFANDPLLLDESLWALRNLGQAGGLAGADISAIDAWDLRTDASEVVLGIVDTGARLDHEDLAPNLWVNAGEIPGNGIDDDGNGVVDDIHGFDAAQSDGRPQDNNGHGTHVAGTAAASGNNGIGSTGVAWKAQVMVLRFMADGRGFTSDAIAAIDYARLHGASVLNNSWGGGSFSNALSAAIQRAADADILFVAAAGNEGSDNDQQPSYPASYDIDSIVSVASTDRRDRLSPFSNFGRNSVHLAAPGSAIRSTYFESPQSYLSLSGTSMAAPHVAGAAALLRAEFPDESALQIKQRLLASVDPAPELINTTLSGGRLNLFAALGGAVGPRPGVVSFERPQSVVAETARETAVIVSRRAGSTGTATVAYQTVSGSAEEGSDFEPANGLLRWEDGDASERILSVPLIDDDLLEGRESFTIRLELEDGQAQLGVPGEVEVAILDDEFEPLDGFSFAQVQESQAERLASSVPDPQLAVGPQGRRGLALATLDSEGNIGVSIETYLADGTPDWQAWHHAAQGAFQPRIAFTDAGELALAYTRVAETDDGDLAEAPLALARFAADGTLLSDRQLDTGSTGAHTALALLALPGGGFALGGQSDVLQRRQALLLRLGPDGSAPQARQFRFTDNSADDAVSSLALAPDGTLFAAGWTRFPSGFRGAAAAYRSDGSERWRRVFNTPEQQRSLSVATNAFSEVYLGLRNFDPFSSRFSGLLVKLSPESGDTVWQRAQPLDSATPNFLVSPGPDGSVNYAEGPLDLAQDSSTYSLGRFDRAGNRLFESTLDANAPVSINALASSEDGSPSFAGAIDGLGQIGPAIIDADDGPRAFFSHIVDADADSALSPRFAFELERLSVSEAAGEARIPVLRLSGFSTAARVELAIEAIDAVPGEDFAQPESLVLEFEPNQERGELAIELFDNELSEPDKRLQLALAPPSDPEQEIRIDEPSRMTLILLNDDLPFDSWLAASFTQAQIDAFDPSPEAADPDGDGLPNLLEYAFGSGPGTPGPAPRLILSKVQDSSADQISFDAAAEASDLNFTLQRSQDLVQWSPAPLLSETRETAASAPEKVAVTLTTPAQSAASFYRLEIERSRNRGPEQAPAEKENSASRASPNEPTE